MDEKKPIKSDKGLNVELHPALRSSNLQLVRTQYKNQVNPYLLFQQPKRQKRSPFQFYKSGDIIAKYDSIRQDNQKRIEIQKKEEEEKKYADLKRKEKIKLGEIPSTFEQNYINRLLTTVDIEWWDSKYLVNGKLHEKYIKKYKTPDDDSENSDRNEDSEDERPSIRFIQHPVPIKSQNNETKISKIYLTKKEGKKIRRNKRKLLRQELQQKIKLGDIPKPQPKVKLSNMMNVYQNDANITDPTLWEKMVRQQVNARRLKHFEENMKRHEESRLVRKKNELNINASSTYCKIFKFTELKHPKIRCKIKMNAKQLKLLGCCLHIKDGSGIIIIIGDEKSCKFFEKLVLQRIKWNEPFQDHITKKIIESKAICEKTWEGFLTTSKFKGWFMKECLDEQDLIRVLREIDMDMLYNNT